MSEREWTGSVAVLPESMRAFAVEMANLASEAKTNAPGSDIWPDNPAGHELGALVNFLQDHAYTLSEWADAVEQLYARLDQGEIPTNAQGVALARFLRPQFRDTVHPADRRATVTRGGAGLSDTYLLVTLPGGYQGGIDHEGRVST